jgi:AraC-like DNA-binding protein
MLHYVEIRPSPALADRIECFWSIRADAPGPDHRVVPDGCADILLTIACGRATLDAVGPMTRHRDHSLQPGTTMFGARFRPARWPGEHVPDAIVPLEDLWGAASRHLLDRVADAPSDVARARLIESAIPPDAPGPVEHAIAFLEQNAGRSSIDDLAREANLSPRQFRRRCEEKTGYSPKLLARILRFRHASGRLAAGEPAVEVALDCGYYDQPHLLRDLRQFGGQP